MKRVRAEMAKEVAMKIFKVRLKSLLKNVKYKHWKFHIGEDDTRLFLQLRVWRKCSETKKFGTGYGRKWLLSPHMTDSEIIATAFKACITNEEHECRENFTYKGQNIYCPHYDVEELVKLRKDNSVDIRKPKGKE